MLPDSTNPRVMADNIKELDARLLGTAASVEDLRTFDTDETNTGMKWIDGKDIYRKVFTIAEMPNSTTTQIEHGISFDTITNCYGIMQPANGTGRFIPTGGSPSVSFTTTYLNIISTSNLSSYKGIVIMEYTKPATP